MIGKRTLATLGAIAVSMTMLSAALAAADNPPAAGFDAAGSRRQGDRDRRPRHGGDGRPQGLGRDALSVVALLRAAARTHPRLGQVDRQPALPERHHAHAHEHQHQGRLGVEGRPEGRG